MEQFLPLSFYRFLIFMLKETIYNYIQYKTIYIYTSGVCITYKT
jgi:hypothetical protein